MLTLERGCTVVGTVHAACVSSEMSVWPYLVASTTLLAQMKGTICD